MLHFKLYHLKCSLVGIWELHRHRYPSFADSLSLTNRMSVLPSPPQEAEMIISRCFSNVFSINSCSCFLIKVHSRPGTTGEINYKSTCCSPGPQHSEWLCSVQKPENSSGCNWVLSGCNKLLSSTACAQLPQVPLSKCAFGFYSQPRDSSELFPLYLTLFFLTSALGVYSATSLHLLPGDRKENSEQNNHN